VIEFVVDVEEALRESAKYDPETQRRERFLIASTEDLDENVLQAKEQRLLYEVKRSSAEGIGVTSMPCTHESVMSHADWNGSWAARD
jgi:hypothetical protein